MRTIIPIKNVFNALFATFLAILMIRVTYPVVDPILQLWESSMMKASAVVGLWLVYFFVLYYMTWKIFFQTEQETGGAN